MRKFNLLIAIITGCSFILSAQSVWNRSHLDQVKELISDPQESIYNTALKKLIAEADSLLNIKEPSVMQKQATAASGDKHDYLSQARYFWPNPDSADGMPYIDRDGISNPEIYKLDRYPLSDMASAVKILSLAFYFTDKEIYAQKASKLLHTWFIDKETRMNPNFNYAQMIPGHNDNKGRSYGVLDGESFVEMLDAVELLRDSRHWSTKNHRRLQDWFSKLINWMITSPQGIEEGNALNNHSTVYDKQIIAYSLFCGRDDMAEKIIRNFPQRRIYNHILPDGSQPHELWRTLSFGYSQWNLHHMLDIVQMGRKIGFNLLDSISTDGRSISKGFDYLTPYIGKNVESWPHKQISQWDEKCEALAHDIYRLNNLYESSTPFKFRGYLNSSDYLFTLLYFRPTFADNALYNAERQLTYGIHFAEDALRNRTDKSLVSPRCLNKDGSVRLVHPHDWCSGFFPGILWQMYSITGNSYWRDWAVTYTWPIERAKWHKGTHDLGFMIYNTFGIAYDLDHEQSYKSVWLQAAETLCSRYKENVGLIRSWDHNSKVWKYPVIIDNLMNLKLLFRATQETNDSTFYKIAISHADKTLANHFRDDASSYHVVDYDPIDGSVRMKCTAQGYADNSVWSRGQAWGLYGYTEAYIYTGNQLYLDQACKIADFFFALPNLPSDMIPYWDMLTPNIPNEPRDASAAAVFASGLLQLSDLCNDERSVKYRNTATQILKNLYADYTSPIGENGGFILLHSTGNLPAEDEIDVPIGYADYYYVEALKYLLDHN